MSKIKGYGEIRVPVDDNYNELWYILEDFDIELLGWRSEDGYNREPIFRLTPKRAKDGDDDHE